MTSPRPRAHRIWLAAGLCVAGLTLAGCSATNPITTEQPYSASDGVRTTLGDIRANNLLVISAAKGEPGAVQGALTNDGDTPTTVTLSSGSDSTTVPVGARQTVLLNTDTTGGTVADGHQSIQLASVPVPPGAMLPITIATDAAGSQDLSVPVLDGSHPEYASLVPTPSS